MKVLRAFSQMTAAVAMATAVTSTLVQAQSRATSLASLRLTSTSTPTTYSTHGVGRLASARPAGAPKAYGARGIEMEALTAVVKQYCGNCHNPTMKRGNLNLRSYSVDSAFSEAAISEKMIRKLRA